MYMQGAHWVLKLGVQWGTIAVFFLNCVPLHIESPYNFGGKKPSAEGKWACWYAVDRRFEPLSDQTKDYKLVCVASLHTALVGLESG